MNDDDKRAQGVNYGDLALDANGDLAPANEPPWWLAAAVAGMAERRERRELEEPPAFKTIAPVATGEISADDREWVFREGLAVYGVEASDIHEGVPVPPREHRARAALAAYYERVEFDDERCQRAAARYMARRARDRGL